ncbi:hypothetical protein BH23GEM8_BH23GEM8_08620 [soil metagenome]
MTEISDEAVQRATGRVKSEWFRILDDAGAATLSHREIVALLGREEGVSGWWQQMITVAYEKARQLRRTHERPDGFSVSGSRTINVPIERLFEAWLDEEKRARWLEEKVTIRRSTPSRSLRITWADGRSDVSVTLYRKGEEKSQVGVEHSKLGDEEEAARMKAHWTDALKRLKEMLESGAATG